MSDGMGEGGRARAARLRAELHGSKRDTLAAPTKAPEPPPILLSVNGWSEPRPGAGAVPRPGRKARR